MSYFEYKDKKVYYKTEGNGFPLILIHGNTSSSKMFFGVAKRLSKNHRIILIDLPGHGKSDRLSEFPTDWWFDNSIVVAELIKHLELPRVNIIGSSGGALIGLNLAIEYPDLINKIIADSFIGEHSTDNFINSLTEDRLRAMKNPLSMVFWYWNHGFDWKKIVNLDTSMQISFHTKHGDFFHDSLSEIIAPTLLIGSKGDEFLPNIEDMYKDISNKIKNSRVHIFNKGSHPSVMSNPKEFIFTVNDFLGKYKLKRPKT